MQAGFQTLLTVAFLLQHQLRLHRAPPPAPTMALFRTALEETAAARLEAGVAEWRTWGPGGGIMLPIGVLPPRTPLPLRFWSLEQWQTWASARGYAEVKAEQDPLYYKKVYDECFHYDTQVLTCTHKNLSLIHI